MERADKRTTLGVGMIGYGFMGRAHSHALRSVGSVFDLPLAPRMVSLAGRNPRAVEAAAARLGWQHHDTSWEALIARDDIELVIVGTPGNSHAEIATAALDAGKHVLCEKPLANSIEQGAAMVAAAQRARTRGVRSMLAHNYRRVPAIEYARTLIAAGEIGHLYQVRAAYLQDWLSDPDTPTSWRLDTAVAGTGALGDIGSHAIDLVQHLTGDRLVDVSATLATTIDKRPRPDGTGVDPVTVDDIAIAHGHLANGAVVAVEATRMATGRKNALRVEVYGSAGAVAFDLERLNELELARGVDRGFERILLTDQDHPWLSAWWPPGHVLGWEHTFVHQLHDLIAAIADGSDPSPSFADGLAMLHTMDAIVESARSGRRQDIPTGADPGS